VFLYPAWLWRLNIKSAFPSPLTHLLFLLFLFL
jgi:hypothetical protein